jgi:hypothetical protein
MLGMRRGFGLLPLFVLLGCAPRPADAPRTASEPPPPPAAAAAPPSVAPDTRRARVEALAERIRQRVADALGPQIESEARWTDSGKAGFADTAPLGVMQVVFRRARVDGLPAAIYVLSPWQPLVEAYKPEIALGARLVTVTEDALVFEPMAVVQPGDALRVLRDRISALVGEVVDLEKNEGPREPDVPMPAGLQVIGASAYRYHVIVEAALPGTSMPPAAELTAMAKDRMVCLILTPEIGPKRAQWIAPAGADHLVPHAAPEPAPVRDLAAGPELFAGYRPKTTPDTVRDFRPALGPQIDALPPAEPGSLGKLIALLDKQAARARQKPGRWVDGRMELGASKREYKPSDEELLESEIGSRIREIATRPDATAAIAGQQPKRSEITFREITVSHADVMGSGRYFYASAPAKTRVALAGR